MTTKFVGEVSAYTPGKNGAKGTYRRIGSFFQRDDGRLSAKIDTLPLPGTGWEGWINFFPVYKLAPVPASPSNFSRPAAGAPPTPIDSTHPAHPYNIQPSVDEDDIPF